MSASFKKARISYFKLSDAQKYLPQRKKTAHKLTAGRCFIVAGSKGLWGAAILTATAAARTGAGHITLFTEKKSFPSHRHPDFLLRDLQKILNTKVDSTALAMGPGLGTSRKALKVLKWLIKSYHSPVVLDADALNLCARHQIFPLKKHWVITPHEGELARLLGVTAQKIKNDRLKYIQQAQRKMKCVVLLKGHNTLIADDTKVYQILSGNAALAKAGTGDVLTGMIVAFLAQGLTPLTATTTAAFLHGWVADQWIQKNDPLSFMASDFLTELPSAIARLRRAK